MMKGCNRSGIAPPAAFLCTVTAGVSSACVASTPTSVSGGHRRDTPPPPPPPLPPPPPSAPTSAAGVGPAATPPQRRAGMNVQARAKGDAAFPCAFAAGLPKTGAFACASAPAREGETLPFLARGRPWKLAPSRRRLRRPAACCPPAVRSRR